MPIFMDRHDMRGATAENVAEAHRKDLEIQDKYGVKYMTYWYNSERSAGFVSSMHLTPRPPRACIERRMARSRQKSSQSTSLLWRRSSAALATPGMLRTPLPKKWEPGCVPLCLPTLLVRLR